MDLRRVLTGKVFPALRKEGFITALARPKISEREGD